MHLVTNCLRVCGALGLAGFFTTAPAFASELMPPGQQNALVHKYCAVCHTDAAKNGGLSLEHYDAAQPDPALAAMLLSKLQSGAMGAAGLGIPDKATQDAWVAVTLAQSERAGSWTVIHADAPGSKATVLTASMVRDVPPRQPQASAPLYRLTLACNMDTRQGEMQLTWTPQPQTGRIFSVSADGNAGVPHQLAGKEQKMGNGAVASTGLASALLNAPLPRKTLAVADLFPGETVVFPVGDLDKDTRKQLAACLGNRAPE